MKSGYTTKTQRRKAAIAFGRMVKGKWTTPKAECLARWPSLELVCRRQGKKFVVSLGGAMFVTSATSAARAWAKCLQEFNGELKRNRGR